MPTRSHPVVLSNIDLPTYRDLTAGGLRNGCSIVLQMLRHGVSGCRGGQRCGGEGACLYLRSVGRP